MLKSLEEGAMTEPTRICQDMYTTGVWSEDFFHSIIIPIKKKFLIGIIKGNWMLPVPLRIKFKICLLVYKLLHGAVPGYLRDYCKETHHSLEATTSING